MKKLCLLFFIPFVFCPAEASPKKHKISKRKLSFSFVSAYNFHSYPKALQPDPFAEGQIVKKPLYGDSKMEQVFSALEISRNFAWYELGVRIQNTFNSFVSPFLKLNLMKNYSNRDILPSITLGLTPSSVLVGAWLRLSVAFSVHRYLSLEPFLGTYAYYKVQQEPALPYEKYNAYFHIGLRFNLYY